MRTIFLIALFVMAAPALAEDKPSKQPKRQIPAKKTIVATQPSTTTVAAPKPSGPDAEIIEELKKWDKKLETLQTRFVQEVDFTDAGLKQRVEGQLHYSKPDLLKIEHVKPARQLIYTDKKELWIYKPEDAQAVKTSWSSWKKDQSSNFSGIMEFGNYAQLVENNTITTSRNPDRIIVSLTSKADPGLYKLTLTLSTTDYFPTEASLTVERTVIKTKLEGTKINIPLDASIFKFSPPKGTEVLDFKN